MYQLVSSSRSSAFKMMILASEDRKRSLRRDIDRLVKKNKPKEIKEKVKKITDIDKIAHKSLTSGTNKYFTNRGLEKRKKKSFMKPTQIWKSRDGICHRLRVESPVVDEGVTETISDFFKITASRPVKESFRKREYIRQMRSAFLNNLQSGMYLDIIKRIDMHDDITRTVLQKAVDDSEEAVWSLRVFLSEQIKDIRSIEDELKVVTNLRTKKQQAIDKALRKLGNTKVDMFKIMEKINETIRCRDFLHSCSSEQWLFEYNIIKHKFSIKNQNKVDQLMDIYRKYTQYLGGKDPGLEEIMLNYIKLFESTGPRMIQFDTTNDLGYSLKKLEKDNKSALIHIQELEEPVKTVREYLKKVETCYNEDMSLIKDEIQNIEKDLETVRSKIDMKKSILHDMTRKYKKTVVSKDVLKERGLLKSLYDEIVTDKKMNPSVLEMWEGIEQSFMLIKSKLAEIPSKEVERRRKVIERRMKVEERKAEKAKNRIKQVEQMVEGIKKAYEPPAKTQIGKTLMPRSAPPPCPKRTPTPESPNLVDEYMQELELEKEMYAPLSIPYPEKSSGSVCSSELSLLSESRRGRHEVYDRESLVPKIKRYGLKDVYNFGTELDFDFKDRLRIEEKTVNELNLLPPPKVVVPKYEPKVEEIKKNSEDEDSDFGLPQI